MKKKKKILLLGGEGFIGRNLAEGLAAQFDCLSVGMKKSVFGAGRKDTFLEADPYREKIEESWDVLIHLIDNKVGISSFEEEEEKLARNLNWQNGKHVIVFSSAVIYANPDSEYAKRKKALEDFFGDHRRRRGLAFTALRLFNIFGKYQLPWQPGSLVANILWSHLNDTPIEINDREAERDFICASDAAPAVASILNKKTEGTLDLGTGKLTSIADLLKILEERVLRDKIRVIEKNIKDSAISASAKIKVPHGMRLRDLETGLSEAAEFYRKNFGLIKKASEPISKIHSYCKS